MSSANMKKYLVNVNLYAQLIVEAEDESHALTIASDEYFCPHDHELDSFEVDMELDEDSLKQAKRFGAIEI